MNKSYVTIGNLNNKNKFDFKLSLIPGLENCLNRSYPVAINNQIIRINPSGNYCSAYYTKDNLEYLVEYKTIKDYKIDALKELKKYKNKCNFCKYFNYCWTEHITNEKCDGCKNLLEWWENYNKD